MRRTLILLLLLVAVTASAQPVRDEETVRRELVQKFLKDDFLRRQLAKIAAKATYADMADEVEKELQKADPCSDVSDRMAWDIDARTVSFFEEQFASGKSYEELISKWLRSFEAAEMEELLRFYGTPVGEKTLVQAFYLAANLESETYKLLRDQLRQLRAEMTSPQAMAKPAAIETVINLRKIALAVESYATDYPRYPAGLSELVPQYLKKLPDKDAWGTAFLYVVSGDGTEYRIVSAGSDRTIDPAHQGAALFQQAEVEGAMTEDPAADIVWQNGRFLAVPKSVAK